MAALLAAALVSGILLLVRPFIFSFAPPLDDSNYTVAGVLEARAKPMLVEIVLNEAHGLPGEVHRDKRVGLTSSSRRSGPMPSRWSTPGARPTTAPSRLGRIGSSTAPAAHGPTTGSRSTPPIRG